MNLGKNLQQHREMRGITQSELARQTGIKQANISRWERNEISPSIDFCIILADFYCISIDELVGHDIKKNWL